MTALHRPRIAPFLVRLGAGLLLTAGMSLAPVTTPGAGLAPRAVEAAGSCTGWTSDNAPPPTIRVLRTTGPADGTVQVVPFQDYVNVVMAAEWGASDPAEALKAGAVAVKEYAWYWTMVWRGGTASDGSCYDVTDSTVDQLYAPETHTPAPSEIAAVIATWGVTMLKSGSLFAAHYDGGTNVACGSDANGWQLRQRSAMNCAANGMLADAILQTYYANVQIVGATGTAGPVALAFLAGPSSAAAGVPFAVQPVVAVVDAGGQTVTSGTSSDASVTLALATPAPAVTLTCTGGLSRAAVAGVATFDGCQLSGAAANVSLVATAAGLAPATTPPFAVAPAVPALTLAPAVPVVTWGQSVSLTARIVPPGTEPAADRTVRVERSTDGVAWAPAANLVTDATGTATWTERPATNLFYRLVFDGAPDLGPATSTPVRVVVRQVALLRPALSTVTTITRGSSVTFTTTVRPARVELPKAKVTFTFVLKRGSVIVYSGRREVYVDSSGLAKWTWKFGSQGEWYVRAIAGPTTANANSMWSPLQHYHVN